MSHNLPPVPPRRPPLGSTQPRPWEDETVRFAVPVHPGPAGYPGQDGADGWYDRGEVAEPRRAPRRGLLIGGIAALALVLVVGAVWVGLSLRPAADSRTTVPAAASFATASPSPSTQSTLPSPPPSTPASTGGTTTATVAPAGAQGVLAACRTILPAILQLETDVGSAGSPAQVVARITALQGTLHTAGAQAHSPAFATHVQKLADDFGRMAGAVRNGGDPSSYLQVLQSDGTTVGTDCGLAGWRP